MRNQMKQIAMGWLVLVLTGMGQAVWSDVLLAADGEARAAVVLPDEPTNRETLAAEELIEHVELMSGVTLPQIKLGEATDGRLPIYLGSAAADELDTATRDIRGTHSAFTLQVTTDRVDIRGLTDEGTLFGVYELLEQLGVRWYNPGEWGRVIPDQPRPALALQRTSQTPSIHYRRWQRIQSGAWPRRVRMGGQPRTTGREHIPPFHVRSVREQWFEEEPELFGLLGDERVMRQQCVSNPRVLEVVTQHIREEYEPTDDIIHLGAGPNDGGRYCECEDCQELDGDVMDPIRNAPSVTGRYIWFFNQVLDALQDDYPNLHIVTYVYAQHTMPPPPELEMNPRIVPVFAPITLDRIASMDNPTVPDRYTLRWLVDEWSARGPNEIYYRGFLNNLACVQLPKTQIDRIRNDYPALYERGVRAMRVQPMRQSWASDPITLYLGSRVMWDANTDVDAVLDEFYRLFYGPAEDAMRDYHEQLEAAFRDEPAFTGGSARYFPVFIGHPRRDELRAHLERAVDLAAGHAPYEQRVWGIRQGYERMDLFLDMIDARNQFDFATAHAKMLAYDQLTDELVDVVLDSEGLSADDSARLVKLSESQDRGRKASYFNRFWRETVTSAYDRTEQFGELVAPLPDEWDFIIDPAGQGIGEMSGWHRPGPLGGNWQRLKTYTRSWSDQGLHYYKGTAWYRTDVTIPEAFAGRDIYLWFGGIDEQAKVWVNGELLGSNLDPGEGRPGVPRPFLPFDLNATAALQFGPDAPNTVTVRIVNVRLDELGTGGITAPVMFWAPTDANWMEE